MIAAFLGLVVAAIPWVWIGRNRPTHTQSARSSNSGMLVLLGAAIVVALAPRVVLLVVPVLVSLKPIKKRVRSLQRDRARSGAIPDTLEVIAMAIGAGMSINEMVRLVARCGPRPIRPLFASAERSLTVGDRRREVLRQLAADGGPSLTAVCEVLISADRDGASVALVLDRLAAEAGRARRLAADERARRAPVLMLAPLTLCSLPAVLIGTVFPFVLLSFGQTSL